jgi:hypothetical protein
MSTHPSGQRQRRLGLGWHWLWFLPLCVVVLSLVEWHMIHYALAFLKLGWQRWTWGSLISPSADFCVTVMAASVVLPVFGLVFVAVLVAARQRWRYLVLLIVGIFLLPFITDTFMWGSFPFIFDDAGVARLRMIPFIPWPSGRYLEL